MLFRKIIFAKIDEPLTFWLYTNLNYRVMFKIQNMTQRFENTLKGPIFGAPCTTYRDQIQ